MKSLPPVQHKLNTEKPNAIKFQFNHTAKFIYRIKFDHLQTKADVLFGSGAKCTSQKCVPLGKAVFPPQRCASDGKFWLNLVLTVQCSTRRKEEKALQKILSKQRWGTHWQVKYRTVLPGRIWTPGMRRTLQKPCCCSDDERHISTSLLRKNKLPPELSCNFKAFPSHFLH